MSIIIDKIRRIDGQLDRIPLLPFIAENESEQKFTVSSSPRVLELQRIVKGLSTSSSTPLLSSSQILRLLCEASPSSFQDLDDVQDSNVSYETELYWLIVSKATIQTYGILLEKILEQIIPLVNEIWYWDEILGSYPYSFLIAVQKSPLRIWTWSQRVYHKIIRRIARDKEFSGKISAQQDKAHFLGHCQQFYQLVSESVQERSFIDLRRHVLSPIALCRSEAKHNQACLKQMREISASGLGILTEEALRFNFADENTNISQSEIFSYKVIVEQSISLLEAVLRNISSSEMKISKFEDEVTALTFGSDILQLANPSVLSEKLEQLLKFEIPNYTSSTQKLVYKCSRPSKVTRYWLPVTALLFSSTTILQLFFKKKANLARCIRSLGETVRDFCLNWVLEPIKRLVSTIRHDPNSELAIMSKKSLKGDRDSLERMVVEFAIDNPHFVEGKNTTLDQTQISDIRVKVREGDLTPVLRAYEKDLRSPLIGTFRGDLVRTLLIQVQKTKVDVEIALSGIDALLKSQELVFGIMGLTPGVLVCFATFRYLGGMFKSRKGTRQGHKAGTLIRVLRNIDRILAVARVKNDKMSHKDYGLLLCEVQTLRKHAEDLFPSAIKKEFLEDVGDLCNTDAGFRAQLKALKRIRWAYSKWLV
ncbi:hypothetical protein K3495_g1924 [Podosphaera aphanis]|nr:hypothetical protein K3495_g1924 [Podosphaera aphanis]